MQEGSLLLHPKMMMDDANFVTVFAHVSFIDLGVPHSELMDGGMSGLL